MGEVWKFLFTTFFFGQKYSWGPKTHKQNFFGGQGDFGAPDDPTRGSRGVGKRFTSSFDHDL